MHFFLGGVYPEVILDFAPTYYEGDDGRKYLFDYTKDTQKLLKKLDQETVDRIVKKMSMAGLDNHMLLAKMAVEETR